MTIPEPPESIGALVDVLIEKCSLPPEHSEAIRRCVTAAFRFGYAQGRADWAEIIATGRAPQVPIAGL